MRKRLLRVLLLAAAISGIFTAVAYAETATLTGDDVNLRSGPGMSYEVLGCFPKGTAVTVHDRSDAQWYSVTVNGYRGFMSSQYLQLEGQPQNTGGGTGESGYINAMFVRHRSGASMDASILAEYNTGTALTITGTEGDWTAVVIGGQSGYVYSQYVSRGTPNSSTAPQATPAPAAPSQTPDDGTNAVLVKDDVYLFCEPSFYSDVKGVFNSGERIVVVEEKGDWLTVRIQGFPGYVYKENVSRDGQEPAATPAPTAAPTAAPAVTDAKTGYVNADHVHLRSEPSTSSAIKGVYDKNARLTITGTTGNWVAVSIQGYNGYIYKDYVTADGSSAATPATPAPTATPAPASTEEAGYIKGNNVRMRAEPSMSGRIITEYNSGKKLTITGTEGDWTAVKIDGQAGFVYSAYVARGEVSVPVDLPDSSDEGTRMAQFALQFVGYPYVWAGKTPEGGFDCSGLAYYVYHTTFGYNMYRVANDQMVNGVHVEPDQLQPGDLLGFYSGGGYVGHVGIYIGDGKFVHASTYTTGVIVSDLDGYYTGRGFEARRIAGTDKNGPGV